MAVSAGSAFLDIAPRLQKTFSRDLTRQMFGPAGQAADKTGQQAGARFGQRFAHGAKAGTRPVLGVFRSLGGEINRTFGGSVAATLGGAAVAAGLYKSVQAASDLNETISKTRVVFGPAAREVERFGDTAAASLGMSRQQALEAAATLGNLFVSMKIGRPAAAQMSTQMVRLASDLASFNNADPSEVLEALRSGLVGETEPLRRFGINLNDATLRAEAMRLGLGKLGPTLTSQQKAQAAYSLILKQSKTAQGDFARTSGGLANQQRILAAEFKDAQTALGEQLLPAMLSGVRLANRLLDRFAGLNKATGGLAAQGLLATAGLVAVGVAVAKTITLTREARDAWVALRGAQATTAATAAVVAEGQAAAGATTTVAGNAAATAAPKWTTLRAAMFGATVGLAAFGAGMLATDRIQKAAGHTQERGIATFLRTTGVLSPLADLVPKYTKATEQQTSATDAGKQAQRDYAQALQAVAGGQVDTSKATEELTGKLRTLQAEFKDQQQAVQASIESYDGLVTKSDVTASQVIADLRHQVANFKTYSRDVRRLIKEGVDPKAIQELSQKGPQFIHALATGSKRQLETYKRFWGDKNREIRGGFAESMRLQLADLQRKIRAMQREINRLKGKTVGVGATAHISLEQRTKQALNALGIKGYGVKFLAAGGMARLGETVVVGERGPELVQFTQPARVYNNTDTRRMLGRGMADGGIIGGFRDPSVAAARRWGQVAGDTLATVAGKRLGQVVNASLAGVGGVAVPSSRNRSIVHQVFAQMFGWTGAQLAAADQLIMHESGYRNTAQNPTSTAYGMFQFLNGTWAGTGIAKTSDPRLQAIAGGRYIRSRYGSPVGAWSFWQRHRWYDNGGWLPPGITVAHNNTGRSEAVGFDYDRMAEAFVRALERYGLTVSVADVHAGLLRRKRQHGGVALGLS